MTRISRIVVVCVISLLMLINTAIVLQRIWIAESALHVPYKDASDRFVYPEKIKSSHGEWVQSGKAWEWRLTPKETVKVERDRLTDLVKAYSQELNQIYKDIKARQAGIETAFDRYRFSTEAERRRTSDLRGKRAFARKLNDQFMFTYDIEKQPRDLPGKAVHRLVQNGTVWRWKTTQDDSFIATVWRWIKMHSFGPIKPKVSPAVVGATRTAIYAAIVGYLLTSLLIIVPGGLLYRRLSKSAN